VNEKPTCVCPKGFHGSPSTNEGCLDTDECLFQPCGEGICRNYPGKYRCECPLGFEPLRVQNSSGYPESCRSVSPRSCRRETDCPIGEECVDHTANRKVCVCPRGFTRDFKLGECRDVNECMELDSPCGTNAICRNLPGSYDCTCPQKYPVGNPFLRCEGKRITKALINSAIIVGRRMDSWISFLIRVQSSSLPMSGPVQALKLFLCHGRLLSGEPMSQWWDLHFRHRGSHLLLLPEGIHEWTGRDLPGY